MNQTMKLTFVNVGYGEAMLLECPDPRYRGGNFVMVIDGGSAEPGEFEDSVSGRLPFGEYLRAYGPDHIDLMVCTHIHEDHLCGLLPAAELHTPSTFWQTLSSDFYASIPPLDGRPVKTASQDKFLRALRDYRSLCHSLAAHGAVLRTLRAGEIISLCEGLTCRVLAPTAQRADELERDLRCLLDEQADDAFIEKLTALDARMNNYSLMLMLEYHGTRILLPGDTNCQGYHDIDRVQLGAHLFKMGHHGQKDSITPELLKAIHPQGAVCCASSDSRYNSAHPDVIALFEQRGTEVYFSDCPTPNGLKLPPHHALTFTIEGDGGFSARYI